MMQRPWANISPEDTAALAIVIHNVDWYQGHDGPIMTILSRDSAAASHRQAQQKYTTFLEFFTEDNWSRLMPDDGELPPSTACLHLIIQRVVRLGGDNVCERTTKLMASMWLLITDPNAYKLNCFQLKATRGYVKSEYRTIADKFPGPGFHMGPLPNLPGDLARSHPQAYAKACSTRAGDGPMRCPLSMSKLRDLDNRYRCRGVGAEKHAAQQMSAGPQGSGNAPSGQLVPYAPSGGPHDDIRQMIAQQAQNMQQMQNMAMTAMSLVAGGRVGAGAGSAGDEMVSFMENLEVFGNAATRWGRHKPNPAGRKVAGPHPARAPLPATDLADPLAADAADPLAAGAVALAAPANAPQTMAQNLKRTVDQAMDTMQAKRLEAKAKAKAQRVMKRGIGKTKQATPSAGRRGEGNKAAKLSPPKTKADRATTATKATSTKLKGAKVTTPKTKADAKPIDISDLAVLTKKTMEATARECFTSKAHRAARQRAKVGGKAYAASAASWDKLKGS
ncbi:unnamed protein product [Prorocentrum cordatum]|uniref:Uncharacterized protein n=1 Tax=Prorocentrum cordatum TaxID=2364126 RepID=A0ABN9X888_9DINO|nr:unnamed protein product [Polarella glacialis]